MLTNVPESAKASPSRSILDGTGLVHGYIEYSLAEPLIGGLWNLRKRIREFNPDLLIHLSFTQRGVVRVASEAAFFAACGITRMIGSSYHHWGAINRCREPTAGKRNQSVSRGVSNP